MEANTSLDYKFVEKLVVAARDVHDGRVHKTEHVRPSRDVEQRDDRATRALFMAIIFLLIGLGNDDAFNGCDSDCSPEVLVKHMWRADIQTISRRVSVNENIRRLLKPVEGKTCLRCLEDIAIVIPSARVPSELMKSASAEQGL